MYKFEEVSGDDHQMSVAGGRSQVSCLERVGPRSGVNGRGVDSRSDVWRGGTLTCDLSHDACDAPTPTTPTE